MAFAKLPDNGYINAEGENEARIKKEKDEQARKVDPLGVFGSHSLDSVKKPMNPATKDEQERFVKVWSLTGGIAAKLEINSIPSKKDQEFLKLCLERALEELREIEEKKSDESQ